MQGVSCIVHRMGFLGCMFSLCGKLIALGFNCFLGVRKAKIARNSLLLQAGVLGGLI